MPLGIVKSEDYEKELEGNKSKEDIPSKEITSETPSEIKDGEAPPTIQEFINRGRGPGHTEVPQAIRKLIGESAIEEGSGAASAIGRFLGLSKSSISAYANGATSTATYNNPDTDLATHLAKTRNKITKRAAGKLYKSLGVMDDEKLEQLSALEASTVAKNMSAIIKNMEPPDSKSGTTVNGPVITFYAPHIVKEEAFDTIVLNE